MTKICYVPKKFTASSLEIIDTANEIIDEYVGKGLDLTLRQLYYQFVSRDYIPNKQSEYKRLGSIINDGRLAGMISWRVIKDRTRSLLSYETYDTPADILKEASDDFLLDLWQNQDNYVEVWIEKEALIGVLGRVCSRYRLPHFACKGYNSQSEQWSTGQRLSYKIMDGKRVTILHLGDHDPSGIDMTRDNDERLKMFIGNETYDGVVYSSEFEVKRIALNMDQIERYNPPPNPAKFTDSRAKGYVSEFGTSSWELDALDPEVISDLIADEVEDLIDKPQWVKDKGRELDYKTALRNFADKFEDED